MVDAKDLVFLEMLGEAIVDVVRARVVMADRLLDHDAGERPLALGDHSGAVEMRRADFDEIWRNREIENAVVARASFIGDFVEALAQFGVVGRVGEAAAHEAQHRLETAQCLFGDLLAGKLLDTVACELAILLVVEILHREARRSRIFRQRCSTIRLYNAGSSLRWLRSPAPPKMPTCRGESCAATTGSRRATNAAAHFKSVRIGHRINLICDAASGRFTMNAARCQ